MSNKHDKRYKKLFSNPVLVQELLEYFVHEDFIKNLDFSTLERLDKSFITDQFQQRESDLIYKINFNDAEIYIYLLLEFQSRVDKYMALRMLRYICEFYEFLIQSKPKKLPAVFPVLLYNGDAPWRAKLSIEDLIDKKIPERYIPSFQYYPVIENTISKDTLLDIKNAVSAIFLVENSSIEDFSKNIKKIINLLRKEEPEIIILFKNWLNNFFGYKDESANREISNLQGDKEMFSTAVKKYGDKIRQEGRQEGIKDIALKMLSKNYSIKDVSKITGLSEEEIENLKNMDK